MNPDEAYDAYDMGYKSFFENKEMPSNYTKSDQQAWLDGRLCAESEYTAYSEGAHGSKSP